MNKEINIENAVGRQIKGIASFGDQLIMAFIDDTLLCLGMRQYDDGYNEIVTVEFDPHNNRQKLIDSGVMTGEEVDLCRNEYDEKRKVALLKREAKEYARLKKKFENETVEINEFTVFWKTGGKEIVVGQNIEQALTLAGYSSGAISAIDFFSKGKDDSYVFLDGKWIKEFEKIKNE